MHACPIISLFERSIALSHAGVKDFSCTDTPCKPRADRLRRIMSPDPLSRAIPAVTRNKIPRKVQIFIKNYIVAIL